MTASASKAAARMKGAPGKKGRLESARVKAVKSAENRTGPVPAATALAAINAPYIAKDSASRQHRLVVGRQIYLHSCTLHSRNRSMQQHLDSSLFIFTSVVGL